jgi:hypothetical protein
MQTNGPRRTRVVPRRLTGERTEGLARLRQVFAAVGFDERGLGRYSRISAALWLRFHKVAGTQGTFSLVNPRNEKAGPDFDPGRPNPLETNTFILDHTAVLGPPGSVVTLTFDLSVKPSAAGRTFDLEVLATDDTGATQGWARAGSLTILTDRRT